MNRLPAQRMRDALISALEPYAGPFATVAATSRDWASGLFDGARHRIALRLEGGDTAKRAERLSALLPETELPIPRGFVADIQVTGRLDGETVIVAIEALTIDDAEDEPVSRAVRRAG
ncbi:hypothetical protein DMC47_28735 [Nostoc sp. 3335mG]|nr:hypothetical protein DMC47_28735 [Nostoc sp. 3335mG]